jgi:protein-disulfide reductase (glutathione)
MFSRLETRYEWPPAVGREKTMKSATLSILALIAVAFAAALPARATGNAELSDVWNAPAIAWLDKDAGLAEAKKTGKPVVMVFHAQWCPNCRQYRAVFQDPAVIEAAKGFVMILVDIDRHPETNAAYAPDGPYVPRTIFLDPDGKLEPRLGRNGSQFRHFLDFRGPHDLLALMSQARALARPQATSADPVR